MPKVLRSPITYFVLTLLCLLLLIFFAYSDDRLFEGQKINLLYDVASKLLIGSAVSFLFYFLLVFLPEAKRKRVLKNNLSEIYRGIKKEILYQVVFASVKGGRSDLIANSDTIDELLEPKGFTSAFEGGRESDEGFYAFQNQMSDETHEYRNIVHNLKLLQKHINFLLHNYSIQDSQLLSQMKWLENRIFDIEFVGPGYDESKNLSSFIWSMFTGWNIIEGDTGGDPIQRMIDTL